MFHTQNQKDEELVTSLSQVCQRPGEGKNSGDLEFLVEFKFRRPRDGL